MTERLVRISGQSLTEVTSLCKRVFVDCPIGVGCIAESRLVLWPSKALRVNTGSPRVDCFLLGHPVSGFSEVLLKYLSELVPRQELLVCEQSMSVQEQIEISAVDPDTHIQLEEVSDHRLAHSLTVALILDEEHV